MGAEDRLILNTGELAKNLAKKRLAGEDAGQLAYEFHQELARQIISATLTASHHQIWKVAEAVEFSRTAYYYGW